MPTIKLAPPSAGERIVVPSEPFARIVLDFPAEHADMERPAGSDSLLFRFEDGSAVELQDFYAQYGRGQMPEFEVNGTVMQAHDFFDAFGPGFAPDEPSEYDASSGHGLKDVHLDEGLDASAASLGLQAGEAEEESARSAAPAPEAVQAEEGQEQDGSGIFGMEQAYAGTLVLEDGPRDVDLKEHEEDLLSAPCDDQEAPAGEAPEARSLTDRDLKRDALATDDGGGSDMDQVAASLSLEAASESVVVASQPDPDEHLAGAKSIESQVAMSAGV